MIELNIKKGVVLTTYTQEEVSVVMDSYVNAGDGEGCVLFLDDVKSFNKDSSYYITSEEISNIVSVEPGGFYTNYKGCPLGLNDPRGFELFYRDPLSSLKSAFKAMAPDFDYEKDFFHIKIDK